MSDEINITYRELAGAIVSSSFRAVAVTLTITAVFNVAAFVGTREIIIDFARPLLIWVGDAAAAIGGALATPVAEFLNVEKGDSIYRWLGAIVPFVLAVVLWLVPAPFQRKHRIDA